MSVTCPAPGSDSGVAVLVSDYLDCQARALGENGFQALAGGALGAGLLSGLVTIFIAFVGYRFILGEGPGVREGVSRTVRLGLVLALVTSWPAFQALVYDVAVEGPRDLASVMLPASGLPSEDLHGRVQRAYDTIRLGSTDPEAGSAQAAAAADPERAALAARAAQRLQFQPPLPRTASLFVISTSGFEGALRIGVGFLLAIGPLAIMCLLFDATLGIFSGWVRAVSGMTLATLAAMTITAIDLVIVEAQLGRLQALRLGGSVQRVDPQALSVIVILFAIIMLVTVVAAIRTTSAFRLPVPAARRPLEADRQRDPLPRSLSSLLEPTPAARVAHAGPAAVQTRVATVVESLSSSVRREQLQLVGHGGADAGAAAALSRSARPAAEIESPPRQPGRRGLGRRTRKSADRDRKSL